jgi:ABC-2 type transport system permease protein
MAVLLRVAHERWYFPGFSRSQEAPKARFAHLRAIDRAIGSLPLTNMRRQLLAKDIKVLLRDVSQWSQLLLLVALMLIYIYNFRVLDVQRLPYMTAFIKNLYAFVNLGMAGLVMATVSARFVFPAVSIEGAAFWILRTAPVSMRDVLWSKFWTAVLPVFLISEVLTVVSNEFLGVDPFMKIATAAAVVFMSLAVVGLATGLGARYPRFGAPATEVAGSYGAVAFMIQAVLYVMVMIVLIGWPASTYAWARARRITLPLEYQLEMAASFLAAGTLSLFIWWLAMRSGVRALEQMDREGA